MLRPRTVALRDLGNTPLTTFLIVGERPRLAGSFGVRRKHFGFSLAGTQPDEKETDSNHHGQHTGRHYTRR